jgi:hypothetical protein
MIFSSGIASGNPQRSGRQEERSRTDRVPPMKGLGSASKLPAIKTMHYYSAQALIEEYFNQFSDNPKAPILLDRETLWDYTQEITADLRSLNKELRDRLRKLRRKNYETLSKRADK